MSLALYRCATLLLLWLGYMAVLVGSGCFAWNILPRDGLAIKKFSRRVQTLRAALPGQGNGELCGGLGLVGGLRERDADGRAIPPAGRPLAARGVLRGFGGR
ncbi:MAG: hypothetical protein IAE97_06350 [Chthoniobacterales bacterium]|nr:hypothetical protein [Chthoniobacterales bacterium]